MQVGDLVEFHYDYHWTGSTKKWGYGLIEEKTDDNMFQVYWPLMNTTCTYGPKCLVVVSESR